MKLNRHNILNNKPLRNETTRTLVSVRARAVLSELPTVLSTATVLHREPLLTPLRVEARQNEVRWTRRTPPDIQVSPRGARPDALRRHLGDQRTGRPLVAKGPK